MTNKSSIRCHRRVDNAATASTIADTSSPLLHLSSSPSIVEKLSVAKRLDELKTSVKDQVHLLNKEKENPVIRKLLEKIIDHYSDLKTILTLPELLAPATKSRAKGTPRPQNVYILFRKDVSKGLYMLNRKNDLKGSCMGRVSKTVNYSSKIAGFLWGTVKTSQHEYEFWITLCQISCLKHSETYENYVYRPIRKKPRDVDRNNFQATKRQQSQTITTSKTSPTTLNHPPPTSILESDMNDIPSYNDYSVEQSQTIEIDFHASDMCERQSPILTNESALISRHIPRSVPDQGMLINQQQAQQEHHTMISQEAEVPIPTQGMTPNQPRRRSNAQYPSPTVITTARFEFAPAAPQYVETHSTYATYAVNSRLSQFIGHSDLTLFQPDHHFSTGLTQQCYQQFAYANTFAPPPQQMGIPSTPIVTIESQQNTISGTSFSIHQQNYLESPSPQTAGADPQFCYPSHEDLVFLSQLDGSRSHPFLLHQSDSYEFREHS